MGDYEEFYSSMNKAVERFNSWDKDKTVRLISHLDADGITSSAIIIGALIQENRKYSITIVPQLDCDLIKKIAKENYEHIIFTDLGSGQLSDIKEHLNNKEVIILDHHEPEKVELDANIIHINPHIYDIDGSKEVSGSGVVYLFAKTLNPKNESLAHLAIIGAIGDIQEEKGLFLEINNAILKTASENNKLSVHTGLRAFGRQTRPLHKILEYSSDPNIPGVTGSESGAVQFLNEIGINPKMENKWKTLNDLNDDEMKKLISGIIIRRVAEESPEDVFGPIYTLPQEPEGTPTRDAREFATLLNACGRMGKASCGIGLCLGYKKDKQMALQTLAEYKKEIVNGLKWYESNTEDVIRGKNYMIINAKDQVMPTIIGTLASIISNSNDFKQDTYIMSLARTDKNTTKVSLRVSGNKETDLREIVKKVVEKVGGEAGGHMSAAGASFPVEKEQEFIQVAKEILEETS